MTDSMQGASPILASFQGRAAALHQVQEELFRELQAHFRGKKVRIVCPRYNGQPCGRSKPKLQGTVLTVAWATPHRGRIFLGFDEHRESIELTGVEVLA